MPKKTGLDVAIEAAGGLRELGRRLGISHQAISKWRQIPADWIIKIENQTGVPRERLRPDLYRRPGTAKASRGRAKSV